MLQLFHDSPQVSHGGMQDTMYMMKAHYVFPRMSTIVSEYVKSCHECQARKITKGYAHNTITAYKTPSEPFSVWEMDLYGPLPRTALGNVYIFTAVDLFSKFLYVLPLPTKDAMTVSEALLALFTTDGVTR